MMISHNSFTLILIISILPSFVCGSDQLVRHRRILQHDDNSEAAVTNPIRALGIGYSINASAVASVAAAQNSNVEKGEEKEATTTMTKQKEGSSSSSGSSSYDCTCAGNTTIDGVYFDLHDSNTKTIAQTQSKSDDNADGSSSTSTSTSIVITGYGGDQTLPGQKPWKVQTKQLQPSNEGNNYYVCGVMIDFNVPGKPSPPGILLWGQFTCDGTKEYATAMLNFYKVDEKGNPIDNALVGQWKQLSTTPLYNS